MMRRYIRTSEPEPYDSVLFCGICGIEVHVTRWEEVIPPWDNQIEDAARGHLLSEHPWRFWLWERLGWRWLVRNLAP